MSLPEEDRKMLNLPEHPLGDGNDIVEDEGKKAELEIFIKRVKEIWNERQEQLRRFEEEFMSYSPNELSLDLETINLR